jgi:hypothetical protein
MFQFFEPAPARRNFAKVGMPDRDILAQVADSTTQRAKPFRLGSD